MPSPFPSPREPSPPAAGAAFLGWHSDSISLVAAGKFQDQTRCPAGISCAVDGPGINQGAVYSLRDTHVGQLIVLSVPPSYQSHPASAEGTPALMELTAPGRGGGIGQNGSAQGERG